MISIRMLNGGVRPGGVGGAGHPIENPILTEASSVLQFLTPNRISRMKQLYSGLMQRLCICVMLLLSVQAAIAQNRNVSGKVTDIKAGAGLPSVTVQVIGTAVATTTSSDGSFTIQVPSNASTLVF